MISNTTFSKIHTLHKLMEEDLALRPEEACEMHAKASQQAKLKDSEW